MERAMGIGGMEQGLSLTQAKGCVLYSKLSMDSENNNQMIIWWDEDINKLFTSGQF